MQVEELIEKQSREYLTHVEVDPLRERDALQEAQLLEVRLGNLSSTASLLLELRSAMNLTVEGNTALLVARGVREFSWSAGARDGERIAWNVVGSDLQAVEGLFVFDLDFLPRASLRIAAQSLEFYAGHVDGLLDQLPDYMEEDDATIRANLASWQSSFSPLWATFIDESSGL